MTGRSYAGAMAFEVASTGVPGLETIVPVAAPASWYDYANSQGIPSGLLSGYDALADLSIMCASRFFEPVGEALRAHYETYLSHLRDEQIALRGDYGAFWEKRDFSKRTGFKASALIVQGLNDDTVHPRHFDLMRSALLKNGCEVKCLLHQNGHVTPASEQTKTDIMIGGHTYTEWLNLWFTHYLLGVENEAAALPDITVQSNIDGTFYGTDQWNTGYAMTFSPEDAEEHTLCAEGAHFSNVTLLNEVFDGTSGDDHLLWKMPVTEELTINGPAEVHLRVRTEDVDKNMLMLGAVLVESADEAFPCFDVGAIGVLGREVVAEGGVDRGEGTEPYDLVIWPQTMQSRKIISYGSMDLRNPEAGYDSASAMRRQEPIEAGTWYDVVLYLQSALHTVPAGHYLELYIVPFCGFSDDAATYDSYSPKELESMGLLPEALVPFTRDYSFTVDNAGSFASIPLFYTRDRI